MIADIIIIGAIRFYCGFLIVRWIRNRLRFPEEGAAAVAVAVEAVSAAVEAAAMYQKERGNKWAIQPDPCCICLALLF